MHTIRQSSYDEYVLWYIQREMKKGFYNRGPLRLIKRLAFSLKRDADSKFRYARKLMQEDHVEGKLKNWFESAEWSIVLINQEELGHCMILEGEWTKADGLVDPLSNEPNYRLLVVVANKAIQMDYLGSKANRNMRKYYRRFKCGDSRMGEEPIVLRSLEPNEEGPRNPNARFYLHDGLGRSLPYQVLLMEGYLSYEPVQAFLAKKAI